MRRHCTRRVLSGLTDSRPLAVNRPSPLVHTCHGPSPVPPPVYQFLREQNHPKHPLAVRKLPVCLGFQVLRWHMCFTSAAGLQLPGMGAEASLSSGVNVRGILTGAGQASLCGCQHSAKMCAPCGHASVGQTQGFSTNGEAPHQAASEPSGSTVNSDSVEGKDQPPEGSLTMDEGQTASLPEEGQVVKTASDYFARLCKGLPVEVRETADAGRGVFARREIQHGDTLCVAVPVVVHPTLANMGKVCHLCLRTLVSSRAPPAKRPRLESNDGVAAAQHPPAFCSVECEALAQEDFLELEERAGRLPKLRAHCKQYGLRFPLVVARLACMVASGAADRSVLRALCYARGADGNAEAPIWHEEHALLRSELLPAIETPQSIDFLTREWYASVMARLHLNAFRVEIIPEFGFGDSQPDLLAMAAASVQQEGAVGTAIYLLPSFFNHDCDPNVNVVWMGDATLTMEARRDIAPGEELRITYLDASVGRDARRVQLEQNYGFSCTCGRCQEGD